MTAPYAWPSVTAIHPEHGAYTFDVHCVQSPAGAMVLVAFKGTNRKRQTRIVRDLARKSGDEIVELAEDDISEDIAVRLAGCFHDRPATKTVVMQVQQAAR